MLHFKLINYNLQRRNEDDGEEEDYFISANNWKHPPIN